MARKPGSREFPSDDQLCFRMARGIQEGQFGRDPAKAKRAAARALAPLAKGKDNHVGTSSRGRAQRLWRHYTSNEARWLAGPPPVVPGGFEASVRSTERGVAFLRGLQRTVQERARMESELRERVLMEELMSRVLGINVTDDPD
jgi:hypothetical protein